ncbi:glycerate kinase [soil metagenome]
MTTNATVVIAPDSFKGTMSADVVAEALAAGVGDAGATPVIVALADGGEGTAEVLRKVLAAKTLVVPTTGPLGQAIEGSILISGDGTIAVVETATATGLHLSSPTPTNAEAATTYGTGVLIAAAAAAGASDIWVGVGGSASTDGGRGALEAIADAGGIGGATLTVLCDVSTSFLDAARVFAPQKGADPDTVARLESALAKFARQLPLDPRTVPRTGAAGGLSGALWAAHDARLVSGIDHVLDLVHFDEILSCADAVITGEGRLDSQTAEGKVISGVTHRALQRAVLVWATVGRCDVDADGLRDLHIATAVEAGNPEALRDAARTLTTAAFDTGS